MIKILIITQSEPFFIPKMIRYILEQQEQDYEVVGYTILKPHRKNKTIKSWIKERAIIYKYSELFIVAIAFFGCIIYNILRLGNSYSSKNIFRDFNIPEFVTNDINSTNYLSKISKQDIDVIISISCPQLFKEELLNLPKLSCINAHGTLLPRHRGVFGSWWTLFSNDKQGGSTIHTMELKLDAGKILWQKEFEIDKSFTQYKIAYTTKNDMAKGLVEVLNQYVQNSITEISPCCQTSYHRAPTKKLGTQFHKKGLNIIKLIDLKNIFKSKF